VIEEAFATLEPLVGTKAACLAVGRSRARATLYRVRRPPLVRVLAPRRPPPNALTEAETKEVLGQLRSERFADCSPAHVWATLLDEGTYLCSISTMYRVLRANHEVSERRRQATHPPRKRPELVAKGPNGVWSWDIERHEAPETVRC
jgi:hypothetical protein